MGGILDLIPPQNLYEEDEEEAAPFSTTLSSSLGLNLPNPAPEIDMEAKNNPGKFLHSIDFMRKCFKNYHIRLYSISKILIIGLYF